MDENPCAEIIERKEKAKDEKSIAKSRICCMLELIL